MQVNQTGKVLSSHKITALVLMAGAAMLAWTPMSRAATPDVKAEVVKMGKFYVVGPSQSYTPQTIQSILPGLWQTLIARYQEIPNIRPGISYGLTYTEKTKKGFETFYMAGYEVASLKKIPKGMTGKMVPKSTYLKIIYKGPISGAATFVPYIFNTWLPRSKYEKASTPDFEYYGIKYNNLRPESESNELHLYISIVPPKK